VINREVVSTMDIFSTVLALAGVAPPADRYIDGMDISDVRD
jgi:arylsulfatase A-like enzyme